MGWLGTEVYPAVHRFCHRVVWPGSKLLAAYSDHHQVLILICLKWKMDNSILMLSSLKKYINSYLTKIVITALSDGTYLFQNTHGEGWTPSSSKSISWIALYDFYQTLWKCLLVRFDNWPDRHHAHLDYGPWNFKRY